MSRRHKVERYALTTICLIDFAALCDFKHFLYLSALFGHSMKLSSKEIRDVLLPAIHVEARKAFMI